MPKLDRLVPPDWEHYEKFPLSALAPADKPKGTPTVAGVNWYREFDNPVRDSRGRYWVARDGRLTSIRGGHCFSLKANETDSIRWWEFYDQGEEGACVGFGSSRMKSLLDRVEYDGFELFNAAQVLGGYVGMDGAYVRDGMAVLLQRGAVRAHHTAPDPDSKIAAYRWSKDVNEVIALLDLPLAKTLGAVPFLNSWGKEYPHITWMPAEVFQRLIDEDGEVAVATDL